MLVIYNNEKTDNVLRDCNLVENGTKSYVNLAFESGDFITVTGDIDELKRFADVLKYEDISINLDDFDLLDYYENLTFDDVLGVDSAERG